MREHYEIKAIGGLYIASTTLDFLCDPVLTGWGPTPEEALNALKNEKEKFMKEYLERANKSSRAKSNVVT